MINRNNYEAWFLDFAEGNLSEEKIDSLNYFLKKNPDLQEEFDSLNLVFLDAERFEFANKESLEKSIDIEQVIGLNDFEILAINKIEGNITREEEKELNSMIRFSDELRNEFKVIEKTILKADNSIVFSKKESLKKKSRKVIPLWIKYVSSIAAIAVFVFFVSKVLKTENNITNTIAKLLNKSTINIENKSVAGSKQINKIDDSMLSNQKSRLVLERDEQKKYRKTNIINASKKPIALDESLVSDRKQKNTNIDEQQIHISFVKPSRQKTDLLEYNLPSITSLPMLKHRIHTTEEEEVAIENSKLLTPKQFIIKSVKNKLDIDDKNYDKVSIVDVVSATLEKSKLGKLNYNKSKDTGKKYLAINIGRFGIERSWNSN